MVLAKSREFKLAFTGRLTEVSVIIDDVLRLSQGRDLACYAYLCADAGLWQLTHSCETHRLNRLKRAFAFPNLRVGAIFPLEV